ncbi:Putative protein of unknown function [Podospora comata]|uniref:LysM domain-containing protein n=1 Tax=Podospora comata TaxID=48703 RepID=A0ABY6SCR1_PODCO|nr:Putative protein of unknown function [Podospora comata]
MREDTAASCWRQTSRASVKPMKDSSSWNSRARAFNFSVSDPEPSKVPGPVLYFMDFIIRFPAPLMPAAVEPASVLTATVIDLRTPKLEGALASSPTTCNQNLWTRMNMDGFIQLCVERAGTGTPSPATISKASISTPTKPPTSTQRPTTAPSSITKPPASTAAPKPPAPTQSGANPSCKKWHVVVGGDGGWAISNQYGIALEDFYKWNPGVGSDCGALWKDYAVCVGV